MRSEFSAKKLFILVALLAAIWVALGPFATSVGPRTAHCAAVVMVTLALWSAGVLPPFLTSLVFFGLVVVFGLAPPDLIFSGFASTAVWLIISGFVIGSAIGVSGLGQRLAAALAPLLAGSYAHMIAGLTISASLLGFLMPSSTGRAVVMVPIGMALAERVGFRPGSNGRIGIAVTLALACNMPSFAILPANIPNMILAGASETLHGIGLSYASYLSLHFPLLGVLKSVLLIGLVLLLFPDRLPERGEVPIQPNGAAPAAKPGELPGNAGAQRRVATILLIMLAFWMTDRLHGINAAWVGLVAAIFLLLPGIGAVAPKAFNTSVDFGIVLFVSAALGLGALVHDSGLGTLVGEALRYALPLEAGHAALNFYSLSLMSMLTGMITTIPGVPTVLTPMAPELAAASGFSLTAVLMTQVVGFSTVIFPYQVGPLVVAMQLSGEKIGHVLRITIPLAVLTFALVVPLDFLWWRLLGWI